MLQFKLVMSVEKATIFQTYPDLIIRLIEFKNSKKIQVKNVYFKRTDKNLRMDMVVLFVEYDVISP